MFVLEIQNGRSHERRELRFGELPVTIGRDNTMDVILDDETVSRQSAVIIERDARPFLQDLGGRSPVRVNGSVVVSHPLQHGDVIELGAYRLVFSREDGDGIDDDDEMIVDPRESLAEWQATGAPAGVADGDERTLQVLQAFAELIQRLPDRERLFEAALRFVFDLFDVRRTFIGLFNGDAILDIVAERSAGEPGDRGFSRSIVDRVRRDKVSILFSDDATIPDRHESRSLVRLKIRSAMCVPILGESDVQGVLYLDNRGRSRAFTRADLHFANILAHLISLALDKEQLYRRVHEENLSLKSRLRKQHRLVGVSPAARGVQKKIRRVAQSDMTVLVIGESGTGKELVARAIHDRSPRKDGPFVPVNCAAIPENLLESELFGYAPRSGISGADPEGKPGKFEMAHGGTLLLDEIGDMSLQTQAKILRVLEDHVVERLGGHDAIPVDIRVVAATNKQLDREVTEGRFREDLFYRLKVFQIDVPPLRERVEDVIAIAQHFLGLYAPSSDVTISPRAREALLGYSWPGNVRELRNTMQNALLMANGKTIYPEDLPDEIARDEGRRVFGTLAEIEARHLKRVLDGVNWNKARAADVLGINRSTLYEKIRSYGIERESPRT